MEVTLVSWTPDPETLCAAAARLCYRDISAREILQSLTREEIDHLLDVTIRSGHHSVLEHVTFTFAIDGISRVLSHQLVRHRTGIAFSQQSQRYAGVGNAGFVVPKTIEDSPEFGARFVSLMDTCFLLYREMEVSGIPKEDCRFALPQAAMTRLVMTCNLRQLIHMYRTDACLRSQWEIRQLMTSIKQAIRKVSPRLASELKIKCFAVGFCDEEEMCVALKSRMPHRNDPLAGGAKPYETYWRLAQSIGEEPEDEAPGTENV
ncbi:MAG: FAD-dependent thymidylate synthase [Fimbriimonas sp.]